MNERLPEGFGLKHYLSKSSECSHLSKTTLIIQGFISCILVIYTISLVMDARIVVNILDI